MAFTVRTSSLLSVASTMTMPFRRRLWQPFGSITYTRSAGFSMRPSSQAAVTDAATARGPNDITAAITCCSRVEGTPAIA
jgi:hypothetical protein